MGKDCALCGKSIGLFSSEYTCTECHTVVCGHCCVKQKGDDKKGKSVRLCKKCLPPPSDAPKNTQGAVAEEKTEKKSKSKEQDSKKDPTPSLPDPNSPEERQKRLAALEARVQANKEKQAPARDPRKKRPVPPPTVNQNNTNNSAVAQEPREEPPKGGTGGSRRE
ncbi:hypothetical protein ADEAN_000198900 [Angomonas deanei]|uniref:FYVE-type domain-containing protein n=1 Tax=Angomonas deanei TaxID=59799 RepID=A0A7G2C4J5_9TRYP|nr:hypothetical protein ADEAN_000198900 [Angomonas deanei]